MINLVKIKKWWVVILMMTVSVVNSVRAITVTQDTHSNSNEVLIFVSFSMPMNSLREWSIQAQKIHAPLVIRGLVNDSFGDTQKAVKAMINDQGGGVLLDPRLFQQYHITQVPAVVIHQQNNKSCSKNQSCWNQEKFDVVVGDVGLESALQMIADRGDNAQTAQKLLAAWRST